METQNIFRDLTGRGGMKTCLLVLVSLAFIGCAQFQHTLPEALPFMERAQTKTEGQVRVTVAVPSAEESEQIFGFPLARNNMQPVWLEVENNSNIAFFLYHIAMDPDIYSSGEVAWKFQSSLYSKGAQQNIYNLFRDNEIDWFFKPGSTSSGFVYTNLKMGTKAVLVRLFAEKNVREFAFFVEVPGLKADHHELDPFRMRSSKKRPDNVFAAVRFRDHWYYIDHADITSKRALGLIIVLFRLQAPTPSGAAPILTLPTG